jgi:cyanophycinase
MAMKRRVGRARSAPGKQARKDTRDAVIAGDGVQPTYAPVEPKPIHDGQTRGTIVLIGGAEDRTGDRLVLREVASRAGQGPLVVATVATAHPERAWRAYRRSFQQLGVKRIAHLHVPDRTAAHSPAALALIADARVVFFTGGDQVRITSVIGGTPLCDQIIRAFKRGSTVAGTSAGASVMSEMMLVPGDRFESHTVRDSLAMAPGLGLVADMIIDQHFAARGRLSRLMGAVAQNPRALGVGVDEDTAFVIHHGHCTVVGAGAVYIVDANSSSSSNLSEADADRTMSLFDVRLHVLSSTDVFDLKTRRPGRGRTAERALQNAAEAGDADGSMGRYPSRG